MEIVSTFVTGLYSFKYENEEFHELNRLLKEWNNYQFLEYFFEQNEQDLKFFKLDITNAIEVTMDEANELEDFLMLLADYSAYSLDSFFKPLDDLEYKKNLLSQQKAKRKWLRLYAIKIESGHFVITGGSIKLTHKMEERIHTQNELIKLKNGRNYLQSKGVFDIDSFYDLKL